MDLVRPEVYDAKARRLRGEVVLPYHTPLWWWIASTAIIFVLLGVWAAFTEISRVEIAPGVIVPRQAILRVVPARTGIIQDVRVEEGAAVRAGDLLAIIFTQPPQASSAEETSALTERLELAKERASLGNQQFKARSERLQTDLRGATDRVRILTDQIRVQRNILNSSESMFSQLTGVFEGGHITRFEYERRRQEALRARQQLSVLEEQQSSARTMAANARQELNGLALESRVSGVTQQASVAEAKGQRAALASATRLEVRTPVAGRVTALQAIPGRLASERIPMMLIVPEHSTLQAEVMAPAKAIGLLRPGQPVKLRYDAFPHQQFGTFRGTVTTVSRTVVMPGEIELPMRLTEPAYRVIVSVEQQSIPTRHGAAPLQPGMSLSAALIVDRWTLADRIFRPLAVIGDRQ